MTLARVHSWVAGEILTAAALNAEFNNILTNGGGSLISPLTADLNFARHQATNFVAENLASNPVTSSPGRIFYNSVNAQVMVDTGSGIQIVGPNSSARAGVGSRVRGLFGLISTNLASFQAFEYLFQTTNAIDGNYLMSATNTAGFTINCQTAGPAANGRDRAGVIGAGNIHYYAITTGYNSTAPAGICSPRNPYTSDGGPTMPTSYVGWAYLCSAVYAPVSSAPFVTNQVVRGSMSYFVTTSNLLGGGQGNGVGIPILTSGNTAQVETSVLVDTVIPQIAPTYQVQHVGTGGRTSASGTSLICDTVLEHDFSIPAHIVNTRIDGVTSGRLAHANEVVTLTNINTPPSFVYYTVDGAGSALVNLNVIGHSNFNGDA